MDITQIRQGDQYALPFRITDSNGELVDNDPQVVSNVSITIGRKTKRYNAGQGELTYSTTKQAWMYPLTQTETMQLSDKEYDVLIRVKFINNDIESVAMQPIRVVRTIDREAL